MKGKSENEKETFAFTTSGIPLTKKEYIKNVTTAYKEAKEGDVMSSEDLRKEIEKWNSSFN